MLKKEFKEAKDCIKVLLNDDFESGKIIYTNLIEELFQEKQYHLIVDLFSSKFVEPKDAFYCFEVAYSFNDENRKTDAKAVYEALLRDDPDNPCILNNLSNLCKEFGEIDEAWKHIQKASKNDPDDEIIQNNFNNLATLIQEKEEKEALFRSAVEFLENENDLQGDVKKLTKHTPEHRLRVGDWRILFEIETNKIIIYKIKHRKDVYR